MLNSLRADFYRLSRTKGFYITQLLLIATVLLSVLTEGLGNSGVTNELLTQLQHQVQTGEWTGVRTVIAMTTMAGFLLYFCLPLFVIILGFDLTRQTYKNLLTAGVSRWSFLLSKYLIFLVVSAIQFIFYYGLTFLAASLKSGIGEIPDHFLLDILRTVGLQYLALQALFAIALFLLVMTFSNVFAVVGLFIASIAVAVVGLFFPQQTWLNNFDFQGKLNLAWLKDVPKLDWGQFALTCLGMMIISFGLSYLIFRQKDL